MAVGVFAVIEVEFVHWLSFQAAPVIQLLDGTKWFFTPGYFLVVAVNNMDKNPALHVQVHYPPTHSPGSGG